MSTEKKLDQRLPVSGPGAGPRGLVLLNARNYLVLDLILDFVYQTTIYLRRHHNEGANWSGGKDGLG